MKHVLSSGLIAGLAAGLLCALLQFFLVQPQILVAEKYESGELVHFAAKPAADHGTAEGATGHGQHGHGDNAHATSDGEGVFGVNRQVWTVLFMVLTYSGYGLLVAGGMTAARMAGFRIGAAESVLWGLAGYLAFQGLPAIGLPPELPGTPSADLGDRQVWWFMTAAGAVAGLGLLGYGKGWLMKAAGVVLLVLPQIYGAPDLGEFLGDAPPELAASFATNTLGVGLFAWLALGYCVGRLLPKAND